MTLPSLPEVSQGAPLKGSVSLIQGFDGDVVVQDYTPGHRGYMAGPCPALGYKKLKYRCTVTSGIKNIQKEMQFIFVKLKKSALFCFVTYWVFTTLSACLDSRQLGLFGIMISDHLFQKQKAHFLFK